MKEHKRATIYDVAADAGVSIATVSRVLRGEKNVAPITLARVEEAIRRHDYRPSDFARGLAGGGVNTVGIVLPRLVNPYYAMLFTGAQEEARSCGYALSMFPWSSLRTPSLDPALLLAERRLAGAVVCVEYLPPEENERLLHSLRRLRRYMPVVLIGCVPTEYDFPGVFQNNAALLKEIVRHLVSLGHERIALVGGLQEDTDPLRRDVGYMEGLREARLPFTESYRVYGTGTPECGREGLCHMLDTLKPSFWPTAVIALNDLVAMGCYAAARDRGLSIPRDLSVFGCDNLVSGPYLSPALSTVDLHQLSIGARAVRMVVNAEDTREEARWDFVLRESCASAPPPRQDIPPDGP